MDVKIEVDVIKYIRLTLYANVSFSCEFANFPSSVLTSDMFSKDNELFWKQKTYSSWIL